MPDNGGKIPGTMKLLYGGTNCGEAYTLIPFHFKSNTLDIANKQLTLFKPLLFTNVTWPKKAIISVYWVKTLSLTQS